MKATQLIAFGALALAMATSMAYAQDAQGPDQANSVQAQKAAKARATMERLFNKGAPIPGSPEASMSPEERQAAKAAKIRGTLENISHKTPGQAARDAGSSIHAKLEAFKKRHAEREWAKGLTAPKPPAP